MRKGTIHKWNGSVGYICNHQLIFLLVTPHKPLALIVPAFSTVILFWCADGNFWYWHQYLFIYLFFVVMYGIGW